MGGVRPDRPAGGFNQYETSSDNPVLYRDPTGLIGEGPTINADNVLPRPGEEGYGAPWWQQPRNVEINGERAIKEHTIPGAQPEAVTFDPTTGQSDYHNRGPEYKKDYTVLLPESKTYVKTHISGDVPSDNARTVLIKRMQENARNRPRPRRGLESRYT